MLLFNYSNKNKTMKTNRLFSKAALCMALLLTCTYGKINAQSWNIAGNAGIAAATNYLGTSDANDLVIRTNAAERGRVIGATGEWRFGSTANYVSIDGTGKLKFNGTAAYQVGSNKYAFQLAANPNSGLFFNTALGQYEFRNTAATSIFSINAATGAGNFSGSLKVGAYTLPATDGTVNQVLKTDGAGNLTWKVDNNTPYFAGSGLSLVGSTFNNTAPDQVVSLSGTNGITISGSYPSFTVNAANLWKTIGNSGTSAATNFIGTTDAIDFVTRTSNAERMRVTSTGNVGIGVTAPITKLHVNGGGTTSLSAPGNIVSGDIASYNVSIDNNEIQARNNGAGSTLFLNYWGGPTWLGNQNGSAIPALYAAADGTLGARGYNNSAYALNVNASSSYNGINVTDPGDKYAFYNVKTGNNQSIYVENTNTDATGSIIQAHSHSSMKAIEGISDYAGTGVYGSAYYGAGVYGSDGAGGDGVKGYSSFGFGTTGSTTDGFAGVYGYSGGEGIGVYGNSTDGVGVYGVTSGSSSLSAYAGKFVSNNYRGIYASGGPGWYTGYFNGDVYATGVFQSSDAKLKKNIKDFGNAMDIINRLQPKNYEFRNDGNFAKMNLPKGTHYGLIAQDLEKVLPGLVKEEAFETRDATNPSVKYENGKVVKPVRAESESIDVKAVNYTELIPVMIKAMQEQDKTIENQKSAIAEQNIKIEALTQLVNKLAAGQQVSTVTEGVSQATTVSLTGAALDQNIPNPFANATRINYTLPQKFTTAKIVIIDNNGKTIKQVNLSGSGKGSVNVEASTIAAGAYSYSLFIDGKIAGSKQMIIAR